MNQRLLPLACLIGCALASAGAGAAGYQRLQQSASGLGNAFAGSAAAAEDASTVHFNPAGMSRLPERNAALALTGERLELKFSGGGGDAGGSTGLGAAYLTWPLSANLTFGLGLNSPYGIDTEYDPGWVGAGLGLKTEIKSVGLMPALSWKVSDALSVGASLIYQRLDGEFSNNALRFSGDDGGWGAQIGALYQLSPRMRLGATYRSAVTHDLEGTLDNALALSSQSSTTRLRTPDSFTISVWQQLDDRWEMLGDLSRTGFRRGQQLQFAPGVSEPLSLRPSWRAALGGNYRWSDVWKLRMGLAYERAASDGEPSVRLPDSRRFWLSVGAQYRFSPKDVLEIGYSHLFVKDRPINTPPVTGEYESSVDLIGVQYNRRF